MESRILRRANPTITKKGKSKKGKDVFANGDLLRDLTLDDVEENIAWYVVKKPHFILPLGSYAVAFMDSKEGGNTIGHGDRQNDMPWIPPHVSIGLTGQQPPFQKFWRRSPPSGAPKDMLGYLQGQLYHDEKVIWVEFMTVRTQFRRSKINSFMLAFIQKNYPDYKVEFSSETAAGKKFIKKFSNPSYPVPEKVSKAFRKIADLQRGEPEKAMLRMAYFSSGVLPWAAEHIGDLNHRMNEEFSWGSHGSIYSYGYNDVKDKITRALGVLKNEYGWLREALENMENNAKYNSQDPLEHKKNMRKLSIAYRKAHAKLPVYNEMQYLAQEAAKAIGDWDGPKAIDLLTVLKNKSANVDTYMQNITDYELDKNGELLTFSKRRKK
jgi:hypothetical protein